MLSLRGLAPRTSFWHDAQFDTIRLGRITEMVTRIKITLPTAYLIRSASPCSPAKSPSCHRKQGPCAPEQTLGEISNPVNRVMGATTNDSATWPSDRERRLQFSGMSPMLKNFIFTIGLV
jgi:hypothetical protein